MAGDGIEPLGMLKCLIRVLENDLPPTLKQIQMDTQKVSPYVILLTLTDPEALEDWRHLQCLIDRARYSQPLLQPIHLIFPETTRNWHSQLHAALSRLRAASEKHWLGGCTVESRICGYPCSHAQVVAKVIVRSIAMRLFSCP